MTTVSTEIGTQVLFENENIRVWEMTLAPGEHCGPHKHLHDYLFVYVTPDNLLEVEFEDGSQARRHYDDGFVQWNAVTARGLPPHTLTNSGDHVHRQILVEFLQTRTDTPEPQSLDNGRVAEV
jgi:hypothetical protein